MTLKFRASQFLFAFFVTMLVTTPVWSQENPYTYVRMSLGVPWFLYFVFLACILIPFAILIIIAWRRYLIGADDEDKPITKRRF